MKTLIDDIERGNNFLQGFTERDLNSREDIGTGKAASLEAYLAENDHEYILEIPGSELRDKEMELGIGDDHLSIFLRRADQSGLEYRTVLFAEEVNPASARAEEKDGMYRIVVPKVINTG